MLSLLVQQEVLLHLAAKTMSFFSASKQFLLPGIPGPIIVSEVTENYCTLKWGSPENINKVPVAFYEVSRQVDGCDNWEICNDKETNCWCVVNNLKPKTGYYFRVIAIASSNNAARSEPRETNEIVRTKRKHA